MRVPYGWLMELLQADISPSELADALTMGGLEVEETRDWTSEDGLATDQVLVTKVTANRGDMLSILGVARQAAALLQTTYKLPEFPTDFVSDPVSGGLKVSDERVTIELADPVGCPRYCGLLLEGIKLAPSPPWLAHRLEAAGMRPLINVVDCTNYVMLELGQPLHAFDFRLLRKGHIIVRRAHEGEQILTLDRQWRTLTAEDLLIADPSGPAALAGVMGGADTEINDKSTTVLLESAHFDPTTIRKTALRLGLGSEASHRFERHVDPNGTLRALARVTQLIQQTAGGEIIGKALDARAEDFAPREITLRPERCNQILGTRLSPEEMARCLRAIDFEVDQAAGVAEGNQAAGVASCATGPAASAGPATGPAASASAAPATGPAASASAGRATGPAASAGSATGPAASAGSATGPAASAGPATGPAASASAAPATGPAASASAGRATGPAAHDAAPVALCVQVPRLRWDIEREIDLIEEVAIIYGYENLPMTVPGKLSQSGLLTRRQKLVRQVGEVLRQCGLNETLSFSVSCPADLDRLCYLPQAPQRTMLPLANPMIDTQSHMRTTLLPAMLEAAENNVRQRVTDVALYEINKVFIPVETEQLPQEPLRVAGLIMGSVLTADWNAPEQLKQPDFFLVKGIIEQVCESLGVEGVTFTRTQHPSFHPGRCAALGIGGIEAGVFGEVTAQVQEAYDLPERTYAFELDLEQLLAAACEFKQYEPLARFPASGRDLALVLPDDDAHTAARLEEIIRSAGGETLREVEPFDLFIDPQRLGAGMKSLAFSLEFRAANRTLTDEEIDAAMGAIRERVTQETAGKVRDA